MPKYTYEQLPTNSISSVIYDTPELTIGKIARLVSRTAAQSIISIGLNEVAEALNVGKTLNSTQMRMIADYVIDNFHYLKPSEIKYCFHRGIFQGETYNKLDCNIIGKWIKSYDMMRDDETSSRSLSKEQETKTMLDGIEGYEMMIQSLVDRASDGDKDAIESLKRWKLSDSRMAFKERHFPDKFKKKNIYEKDK